MKLELQKFGKLGHVVKVIGLCLPPVIISLIGLAALSRKEGWRHRGRPQDIARRPLQAAAARSS